MVVGCAGKESTIKEDLATKLRGGGNSSSGCVSAYRKANDLMAIIGVESVKVRYILRHERQISKRSPRSLLV